MEKTFEQWWSRNYEFIIDVVEILTKGLQFISCNLVRASAFMFSETIAQWKLKINAYYHIMFFLSNRKFIDLNPEPIEIVW